MLPPCDVELELELDEPRPLLELLSSELELELLPLELELEPELLVELVSSVELAVVPVLPESDCLADRTATDSPVPPIPITAVAIAAAPARRNHRLRAALGLDSSKASVVTMADSLAGGASAALQEKVKRPSSLAESSLRAPLRKRRGR